MMIDALFTRSRRCTSVYALVLAMASSLVLGCKTPEAAPGTNEPEPAPEAQETGPSDGGTAMKSGRRVRIDTLDPSPVQLEAGIPYLRFAVPLDDAASRGKADAPVTLVMFSDFECPYCTEANRLVKALEAEYGDKLRFVYKAFPIERHPYAMVAALMGFSAFDQDPAKFWTFHDLLYSGNRLDEDVLTEYAARAGLSMPSIEAELESMRYGANLRRDLRQGKRFDVRSTPTFFINGRKVSGAQPADRFATVIDEELARTP